MTEQNSVCQTRVNRNSERRFKFLFRCKSLFRERLIVQTILDVLSRLRRPFTWRQTDRLTKKKAIHRVRLLVKCHNVMDVRVPDAVVALPSLMLSVAAAFVFPERCPYERHSEKLQILPLLTGRFRRAANLDNRHRHSVSLTASVIATGTLATFSGCRSAFGCLLITNPIGVLAYIVEYLALTLRLVRNRNNSDMCSGRNCSYRRGPGIRRCVFFRSISPTVSLVVARKARNPGIASRMLFDRALPLRRLGINQATESDRQIRPTTLVKFRRSVTSNRNIAYHTPHQ